MCNKTEPCIYKEGILTIMNKALAATKHYTISDFAIYKLCIFSIGTLFGLLLAGCKRIAKPVRALLASFAVASFVYIMAKTLFEYWDWE